MKTIYEEPALYISVFDDEDDIVTMSGVKTNATSSEQAMEFFSDATGGSVSIYSVDVNEK